MSEEKGQRGSGYDYNQQSNDLLDEIFRDFQKSGGLNKNPYKEKTIHVQTDRGEGAAMNSIMKNANILPPWLELQQEIQDQIKHLIERMLALTNAEIESELEKINEKVKKYNNFCPPQLQKVRIFRESIETQFKNWS